MACDEPRRNFKEKS